VNIAKLKMLEKILASMEIPPSQAP